MVRVRLEDLVLAAFRQAMEEGQLETAEHLLRALETICSDEMPGSPLANAYLTLDAKKTTKSRH